MQIALNTKTKNLEEKKLENNFFMIMKMVDKTETTTSHKQAPAHVYSDNEILSMMTLQNEMFWCYHEN